MSPSATRAAIMGSVYLAALLFGRPRSVLSALGLAAALMVAVDPNVSGASRSSSASPPSGHRPAGRPPLPAGPRHTRGPCPTRSLSAWLFSAIGYPRSHLGRRDPLPRSPWWPSTSSGSPWWEFPRPSWCFPPSRSCSSPGRDRTDRPGKHDAGGARGWIAWASTAYVTGVVGVVARLPVTGFDAGALAPVLVWIYYGALVAVLLRGTLRPLAVRSAKEASTFALALSRIPAGVQWPLIVAVASVAVLLWTAALTQRDRALASSSST